MTVLRLSIMNIHLWCIPFPMKALSYGTFPIYLSSFWIKLKKSYHYKKRFFASWSIQASLLRESIVKPIHKIERSRSILCGQQCQDKQRKYFINFCVFFLLNCTKGLYQEKRRIFGLRGFTKKLTKHVFLDKKLYSSQEI